MASKGILSIAALTPLLASARFLNTTSYLPPSSPEAKGIFSATSTNAPPPRVHRFDYVDCSFESSANAGDTCDSFSAEWGLTDAQFAALNPGLVCPGPLVDGQLYCVIGTVATGTPSPSFTSSTSFTSSSSIPTTTTPTSTTSTTTAANQPQQSGLVANCNDFYLVQGGDSCDSIDSKFGITFAQFDAWNPSITKDSQCTNLLAGYYVCVGVPGATTIAPTKTTPGNGIQTPTPTQSGMASDCSKFDLVQSGETCQSISTEFNIPIAKFYEWNPAVGSNCGSLWTGYYVCVDTLEYHPTTTSAGNGIATPTPIEPGMVSNCDKFHEVVSGDTCDGIANEEGCTVAQIEEWNPNVKSDCSALWVGYEICVGIQ